MPLHGPDPVSSRQKELGAFYTPAAIARELVRWAIRAPSETILDPSFGSLALLQAAEDRLRTLGATEATRPPSDLDQ